MAEKEYIERKKAYTLAKKVCKAVDSNPRVLLPRIILDLIDDLPAADVLPRDEAIKMGAELAAMHGSDATSQQLEEAYLKGVEDGMTRRDVRPVVKAKWVYTDRSRLVCSNCGNPVAFALKDDGWHHGDFCPNCGARMEGS